ncbi:multidrug resistance efflux transporter family protein [Desulfopila sp. IMCC35008]|uniref:DMT family transporter n=1 Tax=Desulfopila sp. IMCC35008 TaxID=2653858 RepID=UPI0013D16DB7|nr:multidrug resistance efflux transporter family protein [Desulfopila sp. IMCC35008]
MAKLLLLGVLSGAFFSSTFILNELMSLKGGHWVWSASLRYLFMFLLLTGIALFNGGIQQLSALTRLFNSYWKFWVLTGSIGFGGFYSLICFSADFSPGWVIAATWQFTVVASLFVFMLFGHSFKNRVWLFSLLIFIGVLLVNVSHIEEFSLKALLYGGAPVLLAAFCYPLGNQLVWEASHGGNTRIPDIASPLLENVFNKVLLMTAGSLPLWAVLILTSHPPAPSADQIANTLLVALLSGVFATSLFLFARNLASTPGELAGVDATQASEVIFALLGGILFLGGSTPTVTSITGLILIMAGLILFIRFQDG